MLKSLILALMVSAPAQSQTYLCGGVEPFWSLEITPERGVFSSPDKASQTYEIPLTTQTRGREWPIAFTMIGESTTGIALLRKRACSDTMSDIEFSHELDFLTQSGTVPIIYTGCCRLKPTGE